MIRKVKIEKEVDIKTLHVSAKVRYWEDGTVDGKEDTEGTLIPCRNGDNWEPIIDVDSGIITNWKQGITASVHYKVCDCGVYELKDEEGNAVLKYEGYVRDCLEVSDEGYGDYIIMDILANGKIVGWDPNFDDFDDSE